jgi:hypothetical protein
MGFYGAREATFGAASHRDGVGSRTLTPAPVFSLLPAPVGTVLDEPVRPAAAMPATLRSDWTDVVDQIWDRLVDGSAFEAPPSAPRSRWARPLPTPPKANVLTVENTPIDHAWRQYRHPGWQLSGQLPLEGKVFLRAVQEGWLPNVPESVQALRDAFSGRGALLDPALQEALTRVLLEVTVEEATNVGEVDPAELPTTRLSAPEPLPVRPAPVPSVHTTAAPVSAPVSAPVAAPMTPPLLSRTLPVESPPARAEVAPAVIPPSPFRMNGEAVRQAAAPAPAAAPVAVPVIPVRRPIPAAPLLVDTAAPVPATTPRPVAAAPAPLERAPAYIPYPWK